MHVLLNPDAQIDMDNVFIVKNEHNFPIAEIMYIHLYQHPRQHGYTLQFAMFKRPFLHLIYERNVA